jgi:hypothetical protein
MFKRKFSNSWQPLLGTLVVISAAHACRQRLPHLSSERATPEERRVIGAAVPYFPAELTDKSALDKNMRLRREKAWDVFRQVTKEVAIGRDKGIQGFAPNSPASLPLWQTWYTGNEMPIMFRSVYEKLTAEQRKGRRPICPEVLDQLFENYAKTSVIGFTPQDLEQRLSQVVSQEEVRGISGRGITMFSPGLLRHYFENYAHVLKCESERASVLPKAIISPTNHASCFASEFPSGLDFPYQLPVSDYSHCNNGGKNAESPSPKVNHGGAVTIKTAWRRAGIGVVGKFDTSAEGLTKHLGNGTWKPYDDVPASSLTPEKIFTIKLMASANSYNLEGIHVVSKETRDWLWITFWWSPDPNADFGEDRPAAFKGTPWANYKMCVVTDFLEGDPDPASHYVSSHPSLAKAIGASHKWASPYTSCSNPFVEQGHGNARTNCIGCHQHAGTNANPEEIYLDDPENPKTATSREKYPHNSRSQIRSNFPGDYLWSYSHGPDYFETEVTTTVSNVDNGL